MQSPPPTGQKSAEMSFQQFAPGGSVGFLHTHKTHEELYIILGGDGEFQVDGQVFPCLLYTSRCV